MDQFFLIQLSSSFFLGGLIVALQAWLAEKVPQKFSGLIISAPSTIVVNFFFLGLVLTRQEFSHVLPMIPAPLGISFTLVLSYIISANFFSGFVNKKIPAIILSFTTSFLIWLLTAFSLVFFKVSDLNFSIMIYVCSVIFFQIFIINLKDPNLQTPEMQVTKIQILMRALFSGFMVMLTVLIAKISGPTIGALMSMFPTAYLCLLIIIHFSRGSKILPNYFANSAIGSLALIVYALLAHYAFPRYGVVVGTAICFILSTFCSFLLAKLETKFKFFGNNTSTRS